MFGFLILPCVTIPLHAVKPAANCAELGGCAHAYWVMCGASDLLLCPVHGASHLQFRWNPAHAGTDGVFSHVLDTHYGAPEITYKGTHYHFDFEDFGGLGGAAEPGSQLPVSDRNPSTFYNVRHFPAQFPPFLPF